MSELGVEHPVMVTCTSCYTVKRWPRSCASAFEHNKIECFCGGPPGWVLRDSLTYYTAEYIDTNTTKILDDLAQWVASPEGQLAAKRAEFDPRRPQ